MTGNAEKILKKIQEIKNSSGNYPSVEFLAKGFNISQKDTTRYLNEIKKEGFLVSDEKEILPVVLEKEKEYVKPVQTPVIIKETKSYSILLFKIIILMCFFIFFYLGVKNNYIGFLKSKPPFDALISALGFFSFSIVMLECFMFFIDKPIKWVFLTLFMIMFSTNVITILDGQYSTFKKINASTVSNDYIESKKQEIEIIKEKILRNKKELERILQQPESKGKNWRIYLKNKDLSTDESLFLNITREIGSSKKHEKSFLDNIYLQSFRFIITSFAMELIASISLGLLFFMKENGTKK